MATAYLNDGLADKLAQPIVSSVGVSWGFSGPLPGDKVRNVVCPDGSLRTAYVTAHNDTFFSIPAKVNVYRNKKSVTVSGYLTRETLEGLSTETPGDPALWKFIPYRYRKNGNVFPNGSYKKSEKVERHPDFVQIETGYTPPQN